MPESFSTVCVSAGSRYSDGMFDWMQEKDVIRALVQRIKGHPDVADMFRRAALLPCYDVREIALLQAADLRWILTPLLIWRMAVHTAAYRLKFVLPRPLLSPLRPWVRI